MAHSGGEIENRLMHGMHLIPARERNRGSTTLGIVTLGTPSGPDKRLLMAPKGQRGRGKASYSGRYARKWLDFMCVYVVKWLSTA